MAFQTVPVVQTCGYFFLGNSKGIALGKTEEQPPKHNQFLYHLYVLTQVHRTGVPIVEHT